MQAFVVHDGDLMGFFLIYLFFVNLLIRNFRFGHFEPIFKPETY